MKLSTRIALKTFPAYVWVSIRKELFINKCNRQIASAANRKKIGELKEQKNLRIHLGCGTRIFKNWVNVDIYRAPGIDLQLNFRKPLPFASNTVQYLYSEHVLEHLFKEETEKLLAECYRVLQPNGRIRIGVPDAEIYFKKYVEGDMGYFSKLKHLGGAVEPLDTPVDVINQMFRMGGDHLYAWDFMAMKKAMEKAGFKNITKCASGVSGDNAICQDDPEHAFETLYVEAVKA